MEQGAWWVQPLGRYRLFYLIKKIRLIQEIIHFTIHHSFGFPDIFLEGGLETPKDPQDSPLRGVRHLVETRTRFINQIYTSISSVITELWSISTIFIWDLIGFISLACYRAVGTGPVCPAIDYNYILYGPAMAGPLFSYII